METDERITKQKTIDEICQLIDIGPFPVGKGSTEPSELFRAIAVQLRIDLDAEATKPEMARRIVEFAGLTWGATCDSRSTASGGGSTVTLEGLLRVRQAVALLKSAVHLEPVRELSIRPGVESLLTYRHHGYDIWYALAELVDNSVASYRISRKSNPSYEFDPLHVDVAFNKENPTIVISDNAGGIALERLEDALIAGRAPTDKSDLNQFGMGLKTASFWFGSRLSIETFPIGENVRINVDIDLFDLIRTGAKVTPTVSIVTGEVHGTRITIGSLWPERSIPVARTLVKVREYLASIYRKDLESGLLSLTVAGQPLTPPTHDVLEAPRWDDPTGPPESWEKLIEVELDDKKVLGIVWLLARGDTANAGLVLTWKDKAIVGAGAGANDANDSYRPTSIYGRQNSFVSQRLMGELDMSAFSVTAKKDGLEWTEDEQQRFAELLRSAIDAEPLPMIKMATMYRKRTKIVDTKADVESAMSAIATALENLQSDEVSDITFENVPQGDLGVSWNPTSKIEDVLPDLDDSPTWKIALPPFLPGLQNGELRLIYEPSVKELVRWRKETKDSLLIEVNRASPFLENYAALPQFHLEPLLRLLAAIVIAQIKLEAGGSRAGRQMLESINQLLNQSFGVPYLEKPNDE